MTRRDGLSRTDLPVTLRDRAVVPGDSRYASLRSTYTTQSSPAVVLLPESEAEVAEALRFAGGTDFRLSIRSGGHGLSGRSSNDGGIVVDLSAMNAVDVVDPDTRLVRVQAGARWARVAAALEPHGLVISSGDHGNVGVGGLATAGGAGWLARSYGLTIDRIRAATVVLADGRIVRTDAEHEPELFWAVRGAGDAVGVVTEFEIEAVRLDTIGIAQIAIEADRGGATLRRWSEHLAEAPRELTTNGMLLANGPTFVLQLTAVVADGEPDRIRSLVEPVARLGVRTLALEAQLGPYSMLVPTAHLHPNLGQQVSTTTNALFPTLTDDSAGALMEVAAQPGSPLVQLRSLGGAVNDLDRSATAYSHRDQEVLAVLSTFPPAGIGQLSAAVRPLWPHAEGAYRNFESHPTDATFERAFPGAVGARVRALATRYDPTGLFARAR
ncbi:FAD-dependent oxidoreductase [Herbiconiux sp. CPCC 205763]|uniref:FAD-dependent oxidoreductase n=1 Tax=Herbiconiux aconitum TaxID=2970913 RepID=A0ABT2GNF6_9MICO|nr:FAD-dependent oxidoreductase [Herbiconiux aconitum]MCS5717137.1 FAD-dependent oxidoreductase [Herbiconiux aconitum]